VKHSRKKAGCTGQALLMVTLSLFPILGMLSLVVDLGWGYYRKQLCYTAAQSAAMAAGVAAKGRVSGGCGSGSTQVPCPTNSPCPSALTTPSDPIQAGCLYAQENGFTTGGRVSVVATATTTGCFGGAAYCVTFTVSENIPQLFSAVLGHSMATATARSSAAVFSSPNSGCIYLLNATAAKAFNYTGGNLATGCGMYVNSDASNAFYLTGGTINLNNGVAIRVHGMESTTGGTVTPDNVYQNQPSFADPFGSMTEPTPAGSCTTLTFTDTGSHTIDPGTYCSIEVKNGSVTLNSGTYMITGGDFKQSGGTVTATSGVTLYFPETSGTLVVTGGTFSLTAPSGGSTDGIAVWKGGTASNSATYRGGNQTINGVIYMPHTALTYTGGPTSVQQTLVVDTLKMSGGTISQAASSSLVSGSGTSGAFFTE